MYTADTTSWNTTDSKDGYHRPPEYAGVKQGGAYIAYGVFKRSDMLGDLHPAVSVEYRVIPEWQPLSEWSAFNQWPTCLGGSG